MQRTQRVKHPILSVQGQRTYLPLSSQRTRNEKYNRLEGSIHTEGPKNE